MLGVVHHFLWIKGVSIIGGSYENSRLMLEGAQRVWTQWHCISITLMSSLYPWIEIISIPTVILVWYSESKINRSGNITNQPCLYTLQLHLNTNATPLPTGVNYRRTKANVMRVHIISVVVSIGNTCVTYHVRPPATCSVCWYECRYNTPPLPPPIRLGGGGAFWTPFLGCPWRPTIIMSNLNISITITNPANMQQQWDVQIMSVKWPSVQSRFCTSSQNWFNSWTPDWDPSWASVVVQHGLNIWTCHDHMGERGWWWW